MRESLTADDLRAALQYDPALGDFVWRVARGTRKAGKPAGCNHCDGYWTIKIKGLSFLAHRLAWLYVYGIWPLHEVDHIDGNKLNNRITNLRDVPRLLNMQNQSAARSHNQTGLRGVSRKGDKFRAQISANGQARQHIGLYDTAIEASAAYLSEKRRLHPGFIEELENGN